jgi:signal transduction histidine kinase
LDLVSDNDVQRDRISQLKLSYIRWHDYAKDALQRQARKEVIPTELHRTGFNYIESSRLVLVDFFETEDNLRNERVANSDHTVQTVIFIGTMGVILLGLLLAILTRQQLRRVSRIYGATLDQVQQKAVALEHTLMDNKRLLDEEAKARHLAEEANAMKIYFLGMVSHELRTPLASIKGFATTLLADDVEWDDASQKEFIGIISEEADRLTDLISQLLDLSRLQAGRLRIETKPIKMTDVVNQASAQFIALSLNHSLRVESLEALPLVMADPARIAQVLVNLVNNAVKYAPTGSHITICGTPYTDQMVKICVQDQGRGIAPEERNVVFEAFRQLETGKSTKSDKGAGLGLAICKGIVEMHGGKIWVEDARPGARFCFTLPVVSKLEVQNTALLVTA